MGGKELDLGALYMRVVSLGGFAKVSSSHTLNLTFLISHTLPTQLLGSVRWICLRFCRASACISVCMYVCERVSECMYECVCECVCACVYWPHTHFHTHSLQNYRAAFTSITRTEAEAPNPVRTRRVHQRLSPSRVAEDWATVGRTQACVFRVVNTAANLARSAVHMRGFGGVRLGAPCFPATGLIYSFHMRKCKLAGVLMGVSMHTHTHTHRQTDTLSHTRSCIWTEPLSPVSSPYRCPTRTSGPNWARISISPGVARMLLLFWNSTTFGESFLFSFSLWSAPAHVLNVYRRFSALMHSNMRLGSDSKARVLEDRMSVLLIA